MYNQLKKERMGQMLSREDDDERQYDDEPREPELEDEVKEKPKRRRNPNAVRSRKSRASAQGRTRRKMVAFEWTKHTLGQTVTRDIHE